MRRDRMSEMSGAQTRLPRMRGGRVSELRILHVRANRGKHTGSKCEEALDWLNFALKPAMRECAEAVE